MGPTCSRTSAWVRLSRGRRSWSHTLGTATGQKEDEGRDQLDEDALAFRPVRGRLQVQHRVADVRLLAGAHLALPVEVPDGLRQRAHDVGPLRLEHVVHVVRRADVGLAALLRPGDAEQPDEIGEVGVEVLPIQVDSDKHLDACNPLSGHAILRA